ncbi:TetR/AcrR family transcriptional regulator [Bacillus salipaludis]|uniref:TetR/AcrR family transcriptional regulator n=1 Tax=Bacillus salipaludis TaxID=2547811 RepID=A0A4R5VMG8_9BACI|nr:TetR/AcrR family transcriptional regulator [Bacillus salipaludis]MDQ6598323.1 TetR/AcrR family transcriptional regulator [Bacillus salipaludis]TDK59312.1 TetR/AcrR family transcriptional regulator [Bacillus salipaludis]
MAITPNKQSEISAIETKQNIINISQKLFMTYGYRSVSTRQIAQSCGITQPALYHHFRNKQEIYIEVVRAIMSRTKFHMEKIKKQYTSFRERVHQIAYYMLMNHQEDLSQMFHDLKHEMNEETQLLIRNWWLESYFNPIVKIIVEAENEKHIKELSKLESNPIEMSYFILDILKSLLQFSGLKTLDDKERKVQAERKAKLIVSIILDGIGS